MADDTDTTTIPLTPTSRTAMLDNELPPIEKPSSFSIPWWQQKWKRNQGLFFILLAEMFGAWMVTTARLLQNGTNEKKEGMLTLQIIFIRFALTMLFSTLYMWYTKVPDFPWGKPEVRWMLILRGCAGFFSIFGYYYSVKYLPVAEAVVLSFFNPLLTAYFCYLVLGTSFTTRHLLGGLLCIFGVILIAHPDSLLHLSDPEDPSVPSDPERPAEVPTSKRLLAIILGVGSCFCSAAVFTLIRLIGFRAHALISVNYYAIIASLTSFLLLLFLPGISFQLPSDVREWLLTFSLGVYGFLLQFLTTKGLQLEKGSRGTNMMYSQIIFALLLDWGIWGVLPSGWSWVGGAVVVGSTVWVAMQDGGGRGEGGKSREGDEEEEGFIRSVGEDEDEDADLERNSDRDDEVAGEEEESR